MSTGKAGRAALFAAGLVLSAWGAAGAPRRPNILFILADDLGLHDLSIEGSAFYESPNLDRLAREGMRFTRGYASCRVCSPSRASILLGRAPARHKVSTWIGDPSGRAMPDRPPPQAGPAGALRFHPSYRGNWNFNTKLIPPAYRHRLPAGDTTLAEAFREAGYRTFFAGKWHLGAKGSLPEDHGFDINVGGFEKGHPHIYFSPYRIPTLKDGEPGEHLPLRLGRETARFIREHRAARPDQPFLAYLSFYSVHSPLQTTRERWKKFRDKAAASGKKPARRFLVDRTWPVRQVQDNPVYAGMIAAMDDAVGIVLNQLKESGIEESTVVVFTGDNGGNSSDAYATSILPLRGGKGRQWEGGVREPWYVKAPGVTRPGTTCGTPVIHTDIYPTLLELAGLPPRPEQHRDGVSIVPLLKGGRIAERDLFWHYPHYANQGGEPTATILRGFMKLIHYWEDGHDELYDLAADPGERNDVAAKKPALVKQLRKRLNEWLLDTAAPLPVLNPLYDAAAAARTLHYFHTTVLREQENRAVRILEPGFEPNKTWWGSEPDD